MYNVSCEHVEAYRKENGVYSYEILHAFYVSCIAKDSWKRKARDCVCKKESCTKKYHRIHACLSCIYYGCFNGKHIHEHAETENHLLAIDTNYGHVYCFQCGDYQYDVEFEKIAQEQQLVAVKRRGADYKWEPYSEDWDLLRKHQIINVEDIGLRGIVNMGNTCYMSAILQALVHAPVFRDYFLSLQHKCSSQKIALESQDKVLPACFACEISDIVQEFFSGKEEAIIPDRLLYLLWVTAKEFKGYKQQDASEFLLTLLDNLHLNCQESIGNPASNDCKCIIDTIFTGFFHYEYTCSKCTNVSIVNTPFKDIDLALDSHSQPLSTNNGSSDNTSLDECLKTMQSSIIPDATCRKCEEKVTLTMQMSLKKLPLIIIFHPKQSAQKKFVSFPEFLDMTPYMQSHKTQSNKIEKPLNSLNGVPSNKFYLFAVVKHDGNESNGHYTCYVRRHKTKWFLCNDVFVEPIAIEEVLKIKACLLFYHKQILEYEVKNVEDESFT